MPKHIDYQREIDTLIETYVKRLENDTKNKDKLLSGKDMLHLLHQQGDYPYKHSMKTESYEKTLEKLQLELVKAQYWIQKTGQRIAVVFEGRDAAGKGGTIQRFMTNLNPRHINHIALPKPTDRERSQWYFQRYVPHLPAAGEISFFDRSWYNRPGIERVMGFCTQEEHERFMKAIVPLEQQWVNSGIVIVKYWLSIHQLEQLRRFRRRQTSELRRWKLSTTDIDTVDKWDDYTTAIQDIFTHTSHKAAPWYQVKTDDKKRGRIECIRHFLSQLDYPNKNEKLISKTDHKIISMCKTID